MKRDLDLCRQILLAIEANPEATGSGSAPLDIEGHDQTVISYHVKLLHEGRLIDATDASDSEGILWFPGCLTFEGHEFLDASRNDSLWSQATNKCLEKTGVLTFEVVKTALLKLIFDRLAG